MAKLHHYKINVNVETQYLSEQSEEDNHVFSYTMTITNTGSVPTKLLARHWVITNAFDECTEVEGEGVAGKQPMIDPGESYQYTSGAVLDTPVGTMQGSYQLISEDGQLFEAEIAPFLLASPQALH